jgi:spermidine synthase
MSDFTSEGVFTEFYSGKTGLILGKGNVLFSEQTPYQKVEVFETDTWGNTMTIDDIVMLSEKDEFVYHEMLSHVALFSHPEPKRVLIIGGGDGGSAREVLKHPSVEHVDMVEIDEAVVRASKLYLPNVGDFNNPKLHVRFEDGIAFLKNVKTPYDVIMVDGSDPVGPAVGLFNHSFYEDCKRALAKNGILTAQSESPLVEKYQHGLKDLYKAHKSIFSISKMMLCFIPLYHTGMWSMAYASDSIDPTHTETLARVQAKYEALKLDLKYYNPQIHTACFAIPNFVAKIIA